MALLESVPSAIHLFDEGRTSRTKYAAPIDQPTVSWETKLPSFPVRGPESTPVFDRDGNIYFGCHDECFYSLDSEGNFRWMYKLQGKVYSSPLITRNGNVIVGCGSGWLLCFSTTGRLLWQYHVSKEDKSAVARRFADVANLPYRVDFPRRRLRSTRLWASPNITKDDLALITGYGIGLHAVQVKTGEVAWTYDLGFPRWHKAGVAINAESRIFGASHRAGVFCLDVNGNCIWRDKIQGTYEAWASPSVNPELGHVYFPFGRGEGHGLIVAYDENGKRVWKTGLDGAIRGSVAIGRYNQLVVGTLDGDLVILNQEDGRIQNKIPLASKSRGLWTTPAIDLNENILITTKDSVISGSIVMITPDGDVAWRIKSIGKALSTPVVDRSGSISIGSWKGSMMCLTAS